MDRFQAAVRQWWWLALALAAAVVLGWGTYQIGRLQAEAEALSTALELQRGQAAASGQRPVAPAAREIRENPEIVVEMQPVPLTDEQVYAAVDRWFRTNGVDIPPGQLAMELAAHLERNPPPAGEPGRPGEPGEQGPPGEPPTPEQIAAAAEAWLVANVELVRGPAGEQGEPGEDGHTPTPEELAELIRAELAKLRLPLCPAGWAPETVEAVTADRLVQTVLVCVPEPKPNG